MKRSFLIGLICAGIIATINLVVAQDFFSERTLYPPAPEVKYLAFGHKDTMADAFWIRSMQDFSTCDQNRKGSPLNKNGAKFGPHRTPTCKKGWLFRVLYLVMDLAPRFHLAARVAPLTLSVIVDDIDGATVLFDKAVHEYPDDWVILYRAGYHYLIELEDYEKAAPLLKRAADLGAPDWLNLLAAKTYDKDGQLLMAEAVLKDYLKKVEGDEKLEKITREKLKEIEKKKRAL